MVDRIQHEPDAATRAPQHVCAIGACNNVADSVHAGYRMCGACLKDLDKAGPEYKLKPRAQRVVTPAEAMQAAVTAFDEPASTLMGTWRKWIANRVSVDADYITQPFRVDSLHATRFVYVYVNGTESRMDTPAFLAATTAATPHEALTAFVSTLPEEQRARVQVADQPSTRGWCVWLDGTWLFGCHSWTGNDDQIDRMLAALREALAKPVASKPQTLRECVEDIEAERDELREAIKRSRESAEYVVAEHNAVFADRDHWKQLAQAATPVRSALVDGLEARIAELEARNDELARERDEARRVANAANCIGPWRWQGDEGDDIASMSESMEITMLAGDLRGILAERDAFRVSLRVSEDDCERLHVRLNRLVGERKAAT